MFLLDQQKQETSFDGHHPIIMFKYLIKKITFVKQQNGSLNFFVNVEKFVSDKKIVFFLIC